MAYQKELRRKEIEAEILRQKVNQAKNIGKLIGTVIAGVIEVRAAVQEYRAMRAEEDMRIKNPPQS